jgi:hypothetical protein
MADTSLLLKRATPLPASILASLTRPADANAYVAGDVIADSTSSASMLQFQNVARKPGGGFLLHRAIWVWSQSGSVNKPDVDLLLFSATMGTPPVDNAALAQTDAESQTFLGTIAFQGLTYAKTTNGAATSSGNMAVESEYLGKLIVCAPGTKHIWAVPRILNSAGYTPIASELFRFTLIGEQLG